MAKYLNCGSSVLHLIGHKDQCQPGQSIEHDFSINGPEGEHGPSREAALIAAGALKLIDPEPKRRLAAEPKE